jgi:hypothetical protein
MFVASLVWLWLALTSSLWSSSLVQADADFESVRTRLLKDHSGKPGDPPQKYFRKFYDLAMKILRTDVAQMNLCKLIWKCQE